MRRVGVLAAVIGGLAAASPGRAEGDAPTSPVPQVAAAPETETSDAIVAPVVATEIKAAEARPEPRGDGDRRRMLMLLLMNSAGPVRPFGNLGR